MRPEGLPLWKSVSSLCRGHANLLCIVPIFRMSLRRGHLVTVSKRGHGQKSDLFPDGGFDRDLYQDFPHRGLPSATWCHLWLEKPLLEGHKTGSISPHAPVPSYLKATRTSQPRLPSVFSSRGSTGPTDESMMQCPDSSVSTSLTTISDSYQGVETRGPSHTCEERTTIIPFRIVLQFRSSPHHRNGTASRGRSP